MIGGNLSKPTDLIFNSSNTYFSTIGFGDIVPGASLSAAVDTAAGDVADPGGVGGLQSLAGNTQGPIP